jgi:hypothetical protein
MFQKRKIRKAQEALVTDVKIIIPSAENFFAHFRKNITIESAKLDAQHALEVTDEQRIQFLISNFDTLASAALVTALIDVGYKKEDNSKWKIKNWF